MREWTVSPLRLCIDAWGHHGYQCTTSRSSKAKYTQLFSRFWHRFAHPAPGIRGRYKATKASALIISPHGWVYSRYKPIPQYVTLLEAVPPCKDFSINAYNRQYTPSLILIAKQDYGLYQLVDTARCETFQDLQVNEYEQAFVAEEYSLCMVQKVNGF